MDPSLALPLVEQIYAAALEPARWEGFVRSLSEAYGGAPTGFALQLPGVPLAGVFFVSDGFQTEFLPAFVEHSQRGLPWEEARRSNFVGRFGLAAEVISDGQLVESQFYTDWMEPQGLAPYPPIGHTIALDAGRPVAGLAIFVPKDRPPFEEADLVLVNQLVPHLALAYRLHAETRQHEALSDAIDRFPTGVVLLDALGHVVHANLSARRILEGDDGIAVEERTLRAASQAEDGELQRLIQAAVEAASEGPSLESNVLNISRRSGRRAFPLMVAPLRPHSGGPTLADAVVVLYISDLEVGALRRRGTLRALYGLTEAETELVELLCQGSSLDAAADARGVTMNTARSQLKQVFSKTSTSRQSELVRLVVSGIGSIEGP